MKNVTSNPPEKSDRVHLVRVRNVHSGLGSMAVSGAATSAAKMHKLCGIEDPQGRIWDVATQRWWSARKWLQSIEQAADQALYRIQYRREEKAMQLGGAR